MSAILRTLIALLLVSAGLAWASADEVTELAPIPTPEITEPQLEDEAENEELTLEALLAMDPDTMDADACCVAECWDVWSACVDACGNDMTCRQGCTQERRGCTSSC